MKSFDDSSAAIGARLFKIRMHLELGQKGMSEELGVSLRSYASYENGQSDVPLSAIRRLIDLYNINPCALITGVGPVHIEEKPTDVVAQANAANKQCLLQAQALVGQLSALVGQRLSEIAKESVPT